MVDRKYDSYELPWIEGAQTAYARRGSKKHRNLRRKGWSFVDGGPDGDGTFSVIYQKVKTGRGRYE